MKKLLITYRATIDRNVPVGVRSRPSKKQSSVKSTLYTIKERLRFN